MCIKSLIPQTGKRSEKCQKLVYLKGIYNVNLVNCVKLVKLIKLGKEVGEKFERKKVRIAEKVELFST